MTGTSALDEFIPLDRTFHLLTHEAGADDDVELARHFGQRDELRWPALLAAHRVILLSEAGSGKTAEVRHIATKLRQDRKLAFFFRIENIVNDFEDAFEIGTIEEFSTWLISNDDCWIFLDSIDEARLRNSQDFELAIRKLAKRIQGKAINAHVVITGRTAAWRPKTDLMLCRAAFPHKTTMRSADEDSSSNETEAIGSKDATEGEAADPFIIVSLDDLHDDQIDAFALGKGVADLKGFRDAAERREALSFTTRPQDLAELIEFWKAHARIGSRLELMKSSIARRLEERDQNRSETWPISVDKVRVGARLIAAAATLTQESAIRIPDGTENKKGISAQEVLNDWDDRERLTLLSRPIFDPGIYGTVRFHHRSVREYLTAEWLHSLIVDAGSRSQIEGLFFRTQYGMEVVVPTMRPVLPWLAILDERILARVMRLAPEVLFEGGDPSQLPLETRKAILRQACEQLAQPAHGRSVTDFSAIQRFAQSDLSNDVKQLLEQYSDDENITWFLLRMIAQGELVGLASEAKRFALSSRVKYTRIAAFRALEAVGTAADLEEVRSTFLSEPDDLLREWLAELLPKLPQDKETLSWLMHALTRVMSKPKFGVDSLSKALSDYVAELPTALLPTLVTELRILLETPPVSEHGFCEVSVRFSWLAQQTAEAAARIVEARHPAALSTPILAVLIKLPIIQQFGDTTLNEFINRLRVPITSWPELNWALFWQDVAESRLTRAQKTGEPLREFWQVGIFGHLWTSKPDSFDIICQDIASRALLDDRLIALTAGFLIYVEAGRPIAWRRRLKRLAEGNSELGAALGNFLRPAAQGHQVWKQQEARWKRQAARQAAGRQTDQLKWKAYLEANIATIRDPGCPDTFTNAHYYLHQRMRDDAEHTSRWSEGNWRSLIPNFGEPVARAFRDGAVAYWRGHRPRLLSDGASLDSTPFSIVLGLTGLEIEAREDSRWPGSLTAAEAENATRFALLELNGFPGWSPRLYQVYPDVVASVILHEIDHELAEFNAQTGGEYVLGDLSWDGNWLWDHLAPSILIRLNKAPKNIRTLRHLLTIVQGSSLESASIATLAARKASSTKDLQSGPIWFSTWVGVDPEVAIPALASRLAGIRKFAERTTFAMQFITSLLGERRKSHGARQAFRTVAYMKALYLLMHEHVRARDDVDRAGKGVYSPELRDDAQEARDALFAFIRETPGKEAYVALMDISHAHPEETSRPWMAFHAKTKAAADADISAWSPAQVRDFHNELERTPNNHRDLWYLAISRLADLKADLEEGDSSIAGILQRVDQETDIRNYIGNWCRDRSRARYSIPQEEELADAKRPDLRFYGVGFDGPVPAELKLAHKWTGPHLFERLEIQLCGDYLRDKRGSRGIFVLICQGKKTSWELPTGGRAESFSALVDALQNHWLMLAPQFPGIEDIRVLGIDLTKRGIDAKAAARALADPPATQR